MLPQHKKSPEEIAQLRQQLGISPTHEAPQSPYDSPEIITPVHTSEPSPHHATDPYAHRAFHHHPLTHIDPQSIPHPHTAIPSPQPSPTPPSPASVDPSPSEVTNNPTNTKWVRSLKKSEQGPISVIKQAPIDSSSLPTKKHSLDELTYFRRTSAIEQLTAAPPPPRLAKAPLFLIILSYLPVIILPTMIALFKENVTAIDPPPPAALYTLGHSLLFAAWLYLRYCYSRHHAALILIFLTFTAIYCTFHYFPQLDLTHGP